MVNTERISEWKSKGLSDESIDLPTTSNNSFAPVLSYFSNKTKVKFDAWKFFKTRWNYIHSVNIYCFWNEFVELCRQ